MVDCMAGTVAKASIVINATPADVWEALTTPDAIKEYMFGTTVVSDWQVGSPIVWKGEWQGRAYEDKGEILRFDADRCVSYTHYSPLTGAPDVPESYHTVTVELLPQDGGTRVDLEQDNNASDDERAHSEANWKTMLEGLRGYVEGRRQA